MAGKIIQNLQIKKCVTLFPKRVLLPVQFKLSLAHGQQSAVCSFYNTIKPGSLNILLQRNFSLTGLTGNKIIQPQADCILFPVFFQGFLLQTNIFILIRICFPPKCNGLFLLLKESHLLFPGICFLLERSLIHIGFSLSIFPCRLKLCDIDIHSLFIIRNPLLCFLDFLSHRNKFMVHFFRSKLVFR